MSQARELVTPPLSAQDLLAGAALVHAVDVPGRVLHPGSTLAGGRVQIRPLSVGTLGLISRAARDDASLIPVLMIKEALAEPALSMEQIRQLHVGLADFLVAQINFLSGLSADGESLAEAQATSLGQTHLLLAKHFGWAPEQVSQLTPGQVGVYLAGIERLLAFDSGGREQS